MNGILSMNRLARVTKVRVYELEQVAAECQANYLLHYRQSTERTGPNTVRHRHVPNDRLKEIQRCLLRCVLQGIEIGDVAHGGVRGRSPITNAAAHLAQPKVVTVDVKKCYKFIKHTRVFGSLRDLGFGDRVAGVITSLTTVDGYLPEGAPTSQAIANIVLSRYFDMPMAELALATDVTCTRYVDDVTLSGRAPQRLISKAAKMLSNGGLKIHRRVASASQSDRPRGHEPAGRKAELPKFRIQPRTGAQVVTGLIVNQASGVTVPRAFRDDIRSAIFHLRSAGDEATFASQVTSIRGKIAYVQQAQPGVASRLLADLAEAISARAACHQLAAGNSANCEAVAVVFRPTVRQ